MSRAGKFIPGGGSGNKARRTGPIRAPDASLPAGGTSPGGAPGGSGDKRKLLGGKGSLVKPVAKNQRMPIAVMSAFVCCLLVSAGWYFMAYKPAQREMAALREKYEQERVQRAKEDAERQAREAAALLATAAAKGVFAVDTDPSGATVTIGDSRLQTPAKVTDLIAGNYNVTIQLKGYEDYKTEVTIATDKPVDLGTVQLTLLTGNLAITSPQTGATYTLTGSANYSHEGTLPDKIEKLPPGDYSLVVALKDWKLPAIPVSIHERDSLTRDVKFPYAKVAITTTPSGATVREGRIVLGQTPLSMTQVRPKDFQLSIDLPPYAIQRIELHVPDFGNVTKQIDLKTSKDFIAASGLPMVWIAEGGFWAGKYEVRQSDFEAITGYNPSAFRRPSRPVESVSWLSAQAYIEKLNDSEKKAGKLPSGFHYALPRETQWDLLNADASLDSAATSRVAPLSSTQDVGYSEPNKYGLFDTLGNVWEWCLDTFDDKGNHTLRGGTWLSSPENFSGADTRNAAASKYADRFIGFRVVLVPNA